MFLLLAQFVDLNGLNFLTQIEMSNDDADSSNPCRARSRRPTQIHRINGINSLIRVLG